MKKILSINYSQSGQLDEILDNFLSPLENVEMDRIKVELVEGFEFPWSTDNFYDAMPETVLEEPIALKPFELKEEKYDLIILGYQPWFLSPSLPATSILKHPLFKAVAKNTPIITVIGARNMWLNAHDSVVKLVQEAGAEMKGNVALIDRAPNHLSAVSIVHWMLTGKKTRKWGIFPLPGVSDEDINGASVYGEVLNNCLEEDNLENFQKRSIDTGGVRISTNILFIEGRAKKIFNIWAAAIKKKESEGKNRKFWIRFFRFYLNFALFGVAPILLLIYTILIRPFTGASIRKKKEHYSYLGIIKK
ncbi:MAG: hypothetical protein QNK23_12990 [Crocinitomicaceae bacterium]|nr:hypothetical protein [Crocinitomicaceae bacterium]